jgi:hypothetical protein
MTSTDVYSIVSSTPVARELMLEFCSLGNNCEFGAAQRAFGAEPLDLFRWGATDARCVLDLLKQKFEGIGDPRQLKVEVVPNGEYMVVHNGYKFKWHSWSKVDQISADELLVRECKRLPFLASKIVEDLTGARRIFVIKPSHWRPMGAIEASEIMAAIHAFGPSTLMFVHEGAELPRVERIGSHLLHGFVTRFAPNEDVMRSTNAEDWRIICAEAKVLSAFAPASINSTPASVPLHGRQNTDHCEGTGEHM